MHGMITDLRVAIRSLRRHRGFAVVCIAALAIGIGASTAMFSILHAVALDPLPFPDQDRLVVGWKTSRVDRMRFIELSYPEFLEWRAQSTSFDSLAALPTTVYEYGYILVATVIPSRSRVRASRANFSPRWAPVR